MAYKPFAVGDSVFDEFRSKYRTGKIRKIDYAEQEVHVIFPEGGMNVGYETYTFRQLAGNWNTLRPLYPEGVWEVNAD